jgi:hypothetical protein
MLSDIAGLYLKCVNTSRKVAGSKPGEVKF